jgi:uncharacterized protein (DUF1778 family)
MPKTKKRTTSRVMKKAAPRFRFEETVSRHKDGSPKNASEARLKVAPPKDTMSRLEARIPTHLYNAMERAATLRGLTLTAYVTATMGEDARRIIEEAYIIRLSQADQIAFAKALIDPPAPNAKLIAASRRHAAMR